MFSEALDFCMTDCGVHFRWSVPKRQTLGPHINWNDANSFAGPVPTWIVKVPSGILAAEHFNSGVARSFIARFQLTEETLFPTQLWFECDINFLAESKVSFCFAVDSNRFVCLLFLVVCCFGAGNWSRAICSWLMHLSFTACSLSHRVGTANWFRELRVSHKP